MVCRCAGAVHTWILSAWMVQRLQSTVCALSARVQRVGAQIMSLLMHIAGITQPLFSRVFTAIFQGFSRVLFSSRVFRSGSYKYLGAATDSRRHVPAHMLPTNI